MDWDKLKTFYLVVKAGSLTLAAEKLNISQPALSRNVLMFEYRLGVKLFNRHARGILLTNEGEILFKCVEKIFIEIENTVSLIQEEKKEPRGTLRVSSSHGMTNFYLLSLIPGFLELYPDINLYIHVDDSLPDFNFKEADVALRPYQASREDLIQDLLITNHVALYASPAYLERFGVPLKPEDLDHHRLIGLGNHSHPFTGMEGHLSVGCKKGERRIPYMTISSPNGRLYMAEKGFGITSGSKEHPRLEDMNLVQVLADIPAPVIETYFIYSEQLRNSARVAAFRDYLKKECSEKYPS